MLTHFLKNALLMRTNTTHISSSHYNAIHQQISPRNNMYAAVEGYFTSFKDLEIKIFDT